MCLSDLKSRLGIGKSLGRGISLSKLLALPPLVAPDDGTSSCTPAVASAFGLISSAGCSGSVTWYFFLRFFLGGSVENRSVLGSSVGLSKTELALDESGLSKSTASPSLSCHGFDP